MGLGERLRRQATCRSMDDKFRNNNALRPPDTCATGSAHHEISRFVMATNQNNCTEKLTIITQGCSRQVADLINELGIGDSHSHARISLTLAGAAHNNMLASVADAMA